MAAPHVSGALARIWASFPNCKADIVRKSIEVSAKDLGAPGREDTYGHGLVQVEAANEWLKQQPCAQQRGAGADRK
jgi:serine protease